MIALLIICYVLIGMVVYVKAVKHFRKFEWLTFSDLLEIMLPFLIIWPAGATLVIFVKLRKSDVINKFIKWVNKK